MIDMPFALVDLPAARSGRKPWIRGVSLSQVEDMKKHLLETFGPDVNIANVKADTVMGMEALRVGLWTVGSASARQG